MNQEVLKAVLGMRNHLGDAITTMDGREIERMERRWINQLTIVVLVLMFCIGAPLVTLVIRLSIPLGT